MSATRIVTDMMGRQVTVPVVPQRIISLVPSQTELLYDLGIGERVVGITKFCVHPEEWFRNKTRIGGTKTIHAERIHELQPDLIIANKEENEQSQIEALSQQYPVWVSDIQTLPDALRMIQEVGALVNESDAAQQMACEIGDGIAAIQQAAVPKRVAYMIWYNPWMSVGHDTFISHMIHAMGWSNVLEGMSRYPEVTIAQLKELQPELILLSSEPFPFKEKNIAEIQAELPDADVQLVDGEMFSWYGSRLLKAVPYLQQLINR
jgi:ABC-type Fe3+-hydroxamate transport system substrate-binding protein